MSTRLEQLQVARLASTLLGDSADLVADFVSSTHRPRVEGDAASGGFTDRAGRCDLYYTVFGVENLLALQRDLPADDLRDYLQTFGDGEGLDLVHLGCLARCWSAIQLDGLDSPTRDGIAARLAVYRSEDGGFHQVEGEARGSSYACFVGYAAYQDLGVTLPDESKIAACVQSLADESGGYWLDHTSRSTTTPTTAAAVTLLRQCRADAHTKVGEYLLAQCREGGFVAAPLTPVPDLLSTAVALHTLSGLGVDCAGIKEDCLDFVDTLWTPRGGFVGSWQDDELDVEYTFYGLLALGHLSVL